jgi:hypothetical protein
MSDKGRDDALRRALQKVVMRTPLSLFERVRPEGDTVTERINAQLSDDTSVVIQRRTIAVQRTDVLRIGKTGAAEPLPDGEYTLKDGITFQVVDGVIDFDQLFSDPNFPEVGPKYQAWHEVVAMDPLFSLPDPAAITDVIRFAARDGNSYYAVQLGLGQPYQAFVVDARHLRPLADGDYPLPGDRTFRVEDGSVHPKSLADLKAYAYDSTRLPR